MPTEVWRLFPEQLVGVPGRGTALDRRPHALRYGLMLVFVALATALRLVLDPVLVDRAVFVLFTFAVMLSAWYGGLIPGLLATVLGAVIGTYLFLWPRVTDWPPRDFILYLVLFAATGAGIALLAELMHGAQRAAEASESEARAALAEVKLLSGILPICASCKRIRDSNGKWVQLEAYIRDHSEAEFSHGMCPACVQEYLRKSN